MIAGESGKDVAAWLLLGVEGAGMGAEGLRWEEVEGADIEAAVWEGLGCELSVSEGAGWGSCGRAAVREEEMGGGSEEGVANAPLQSSSPVPLS